MRRLATVLVLCGAALGLTMVAGGAHAGMHGGPGGRMMGGHGGMMFPMLLRAVDLTPDQEAKVAEIMRRHRKNLEPLFQQMHAAHDDLANKLIAPGAISATDVAPAVQHVTQIRQQLMQDWVQAALETRALLTPEQLAKAADTKRRLDAIHAEMESLLGPMPVPPDGGE